MNKIKAVRLADPLADEQADGADLLNLRRQWLRDRLRKSGRNKPLRILVATQGIGAGGAERQMLRMMPRLNQLGLETELFFFYN